MQKQETTYSYKLECPACRIKTKVVKAVRQNKYGERVDVQVRGPEYFRVARWQRYDKCRRWIHTWFCNNCGYFAKLEEQ